MDIKSIMKKLDVSALKIFFLRIFNPKALYEYVLDKSNTAATMLLQANKDTVATIRGMMKKLNDYLSKFISFIPKSWLPYAEAANDILLAIYNATEDCQIVSEEAKELIGKFGDAYAIYKSDDIDAE